MFFIDFFRLKNNVPLVTIYSFYAFGFVVLKTTVVMFSASRVHDHSKVILSRIYRCPSSKYTIEVRHFFYQLIIEFFNFC